MLDYALKHSASQPTPHRIFYNRFGRDIHGYPTRVIKGCYRDVLRRAKSFREFRRKGQAGRDRLGMRSIRITYSDSQDWRLREDVEVRTHRGWIRIVYRNNRQLHWYLYKFEAIKRAEAETIWREDPHISNPRQRIRGVI